MAIDLSQFQQVFFEESFENVDVMETSLMELDPNEVDAEVINAIFRAAHSIKGGSATFGFKNISEFTHEMETLLDQIRAGERGLSSSYVNLFLQSVDCLREMLSMLQDGQDASTELSDQVLAEFKAILEGKDESAAKDEGTKKSSKPKSKKSGSKKTSPASEQTAVQKNDTSSDVAQEIELEQSGECRYWFIDFHPNEEIYKTGNDPLRLIRELAKLGELRCYTVTDKVPSFASFDAEVNYLHWQLELKSNVGKQDVEEIFEWVSDESDLEIQEKTAFSRGEVEDAVGETFWSIDFIPNDSVLLTGNDPLKLIRTLSDIGTVCSIKTHIKLPEFTAMNPEHCYLGWTILVDAKSTDEPALREVFEWVEDEAHIEIKSVSGVFIDDAETRIQSTDSEQAAELDSDQEAVQDTTVKDTTVAPVSKAKPKQASAESTSIRVGIDKVDNLINMVGELVITQSMLGQLGSEFELERLPNLLEGLTQLEQNTRELQESVMRIRMLPISFVFSRFPRMVRDLSQNLGKEIELDILGDQTELDKTVLEKIGDPLVHLVRNAVDHGVESSADRIAKGKTPSGTVRLNAYHQGGNVVIEVTDDGKGLDAQALISKAIEKGVLTEADAEGLSKEQAFDLIFHPGFSTANEISDVSGRGVGMDVVKRNIQALNGVIDIQSEIDVGSTITIRLPLTLAILDGQLVRVANHTYIFPIVSIVESLQCKNEFINRVAGGSYVFRLREEYVPIIRLAKAFDIPVDCEDLEGSLMVVVESEGEKVGIVVEELLAQQQVVIKSLEQNYERVKGVSGATILGDGTVALIVDIPGIVRLAGDNYRLMQDAAQNLIAQAQAQAQAQQKQNSMQPHSGL
ncbi:MAG: chemotaxis protein CheA [Agarilytica sp.]